MNQYVAIMPGGALVGLVVDPSPVMHAADVARWTGDGYGCRSEADVRRRARALGAVSVVRIVYRPACESTSGRRRRYPEAIYCRPVAA